MVNGTLLNFGKRYHDNLRVIFDQWLKLHLGLDVLSNQKILEGIYYVCRGWMITDDLGHALLPAYVICCPYHVESVSSFLIIVSLLALYVAGRMHRSMQDLFLYSKLQNHFNPTP